MNGEGNGSPLQYSCPKNLTNSRACQATGQELAMTEWLNIYTPMNSNTDNILILIDRVDKKFLLREIQAESKHCETDGLSEFWKVIWQLETNM